MATGSNYDTLELMSKLIAHSFGNHTLVPLREDSSASTFLYNIIIRKIHFCCQSYCENE